MTKPDFLRIGLIGFGIVSLLNLLAAFELNLLAAAPFTVAWFSSWFPAYVVWLVFVLVGVKQKRSEGSS